DGGVGRQDLLVARWIELLVAMLVEEYRARLEIADVKGQATAAGCLVEHWAEHSRELGIVGHTGWRRDASLHGAEPSFDLLAPRVALESARALELHGARDVGDGGGRCQFDQLGRWQGRRR